MSLHLSLEQRYFFRLLLYLFLLVLALSLLIFNGLSESSDLQAQLLFLLDLVFKHFFLLFFLVFALLQLSLQTRYSRVELINRFLLPRHLNLLLLLLLQLNVQICLLLGVFLVFLLQGDVLLLKISDFALQTGFLQSALSLLLLIGLNKFGDRCLQILLFFL